MGKTKEAVFRAWMREQRNYLKRLKHRAYVRGGPDVAAMHLADEAIQAIDALLAKRKRKP